jgi:hypothetical protein
MRAMSMRQPWGWAILKGIKPVENRTWRTAYRGPLLIHASQVIDPVPIFPDGSPVPAGAELLRGKIIGIVVLIDCVRAETRRNDPWSDRSGWCWILSNPRTVEPFTWRGKLKLFDVPDHLVHIESAPISIRASSDIDQRAGG